MEKKEIKPIKINGVTAALLVIIIMLLIIFTIVVGYKYFKLINEKENVIAEKDLEIEVLKNEIRGLEKVEYLGMLECKKDYEFEYLVDEAMQFDIIDFDENIMYDDKMVKQFSNKDMENVAKQYLELRNLHESVENLFIKLGLATQEDIYNFGIKEVEGYYSTNIKFVDYKNALLQYMTIDTFEERFCENYIKSLDGMVYYHPYYSEGDDFLISNIEVMENPNDLLYKVDIEYFVNEQNTPLYSSTVLNFTTTENRIVVSDVTIY